jgi:hypothetical protein
MWLKWSFSKSVRGFVAILLVAVVACGCEKSSSSNEDAGANANPSDRNDGGRNGATGGAMDASEQTDTGQSGADAAQLCPGLYRDDLPEYQLDSYTGSTEGLCPAPEALCCSCFPERPQGFIFGAPPGQTQIVCEFAWYVWDTGAGDPSCGWRLTPLAESVENIVHCRICVNDSDCSGLPGGEARCTKRIANLMVCDYESEDAGQEPG